MPPVQAMAGPPRSDGTDRLAGQGLLAMLILVPVTLPVPVLRELVQERFAVSELLTSLFMSINMVGAVIAAPLAGAAADRWGRRRALIVGTLLVDAACFVGLTLAPSFPLFLAVRFVEGCAHISALSLLLALAAAGQPPERRGRAMGLVGGGLLLGVAIGAPIGGRLGADDPLLPLRAGALVVLAAAVLAALLLRDAPGEADRPGLRRIAALVRRHRALVLPLLFAFADRFTVGFYTTTFSLYLRRIHDLPPERIGLLIACFMLPFALLAVPFGRVAERGSLALLLCGGSLLYGLGTASITWWPPGALPVVMAGVGAFAAVMFVPSLLMSANAVPDAVRTTALGGFNAAGSLGFILGPAAGGLVSELVASQAGWLAGYRSAFAVAGGCEVLLAMAAWPLLRRMAEAPAARTAR